MPLLLCFLCSSCNVEIWDTLALILRIQVYSIVCKICYTLRKFDSMFVLSFEWRKKIVKKFLTKMPNNGNSSGSKQQPRPAVPAHDTCGGGGCHNRELRSIYRSGFNRLISLSNQTNYCWVLGSKMNGNLIFAWLVCDLLLFLVQISNRFIC